MATCQAFRRPVVSLCPSISVESRPQRSAATAAWCSSRSANLFVTQPTWQRGHSFAQGGTQPCSTACRRDIALRHDFRRELRLSRAQQIHQVLVRLSQLRIIEGFSFLIVLYCVFAVLACDGLDTKKKLTASANACLATDFISCCSIVCAVDTASGCMRSSSDYKAGQ